MSSKPQAKRRAPGPACTLQAPGWTDRTRTTLEELIQKGAGAQLPVVFDFDNTLVWGDIGEATLAVLVRSGMLRADRLPHTLSPPLRVAGKPPLALRSCGDLTAYYEAFLAPTAHGPGDTTPLANAYAWAVEIMEGLSPADIVHATQTAFELSSWQRPAYIEVSPGKAGFPAPFFYPEMVELVAELVRHEFAVWIVSASNVWSVRWMVLHALNPLLRHRGLHQGVSAEHVIGISTLLTDSQSQLYKDRLLVREHAGYAGLDKAALRGFRLTSRLEFPVPTYSGKIARIFDDVQGTPYLCAGDSPGDHPMMSLSQHRLWIARLEKPDYQRAMVEAARRTGGVEWIVQPALTKGTPRFLSDRDLVLCQRLGPGVRQSVNILSRLRTATGRARGKDVEDRRQRYRSAF